jgi:hypothetical protein
VEVEAVLHFLHMQTVAVAELVVTVLLGIMKVLGVEALQSQQS